MREMKDSGVEWIGKIPSDWEIRKIKQLPDRSVENSYIDGDWIESPDVSDSGIRYLTTGNIGDGKFKRQGNGYVTEETFKRLNCKYAYPDDLVISRLNAPYGRSCILPDDFPEYVLAVDNVILRPTENKKYICYLSQCDGYQYSVEDQAKGTTMKRISRTNLGNIPLPIPPRDEQDKIADYLDRKCAQIDNIIEKQQAIIEKLKEYKLSVITEAVTKGLNPDVEMKDSGSMWFGEIPENWEMKRLKYVFHIQKDIAGEEGHTVLSITQRGIVPKDFSNNEGQFANSYANYQLVHVGDFAMNHMDLLTGWVDISKYEGVTSPDYRVFVLDDKENNCPEYFLYMMQMCYSQRIFYGLGAGVSGLGRWRLQADKFLNFWIPIPPKSEQTSIVSFLNKQIGNLNNSIERRNTIIAKLQEYKKSLIYEVVTGKKEV